jgi:transposase
LINFAQHQTGCRALQHHYGIGWRCAAIIWAEIGDARRFTSSDQLVRFAGLDVTVYSSDAKCSPGHLSRQGSPELRWAAFEAAKCAARRDIPPERNTVLPMTLAGADGTPQPPWLPGSPSPLGPDQIPR